MRPFQVKALRVTTTPDRTDRLLSAYQLNMDRGAAAVRQMILDDIRRFSEMGAPAYVADLRKALFRFDDETMEPSFSRAAYHRADVEALGVGM